MNFYDIKLVDEEARSLITLTKTMSTNMLDFGKNLSKLMAFCYKIEYEYYFLLSQEETAEFGEKKCFIIALKTRTGIEYFGFHGWDYEEILEDINRGR